MTVKDYDKQMAEIKHALCLIKSRFAVLKEQAFLDIASALDMAFDLGDTYGGIRQRMDKLMVTQQYEDNV